MLSPAIALQSYKLSVRIHKTSHITQYTLYIKHRFFSPFFKLNIISCNKTLKLEGHVPLT